MAKATGSKQGATQSKQPAEKNPSIYDVASLLKPIQRNKPAGESLRYEGTYDAVRKARSEDDESLPRGIWETTRKKADWAEVETLCLTALRDDSKDLQLAIWLTEAAFMRHGLPGLSGGLAVMQGLMETFWDDLHPSMPEDEPEFRAGPIQWMSDTMAVRLRLMPLTGPRGDEVGTFCLSDWQRAGQGVQQSDDDEDEEAEGRDEPAARTRPQMMAAAAADPPEHYRDLVLEVDAAGQGLDRLVALIDTYFRPMDAPGLHALREVLAELRRLGIRILERSDAVHLLQGDVSPETEGDTAPAAGREQSTKSSRETVRGAKTMAKKPKPAASAASASGPISSRYEAYQRLEEAAAWLMENEPHSPTPYLIQRAVSWRDKSLVELLSELVPDDGYRGFLHSLFGAGRPSTASGHSDDDDFEDWKDSDDEH